MAVSAEMTLARTRRSSVGQRILLSQQRVRGATRTGAFGNEGWIGGGDVCSQTNRVAIR